MSITTGYSELRSVLKDIGIDFEDDGPAEVNVGKQVVIRIMDEQGTAVGVFLTFNIDENGDEHYVCQE